MARLTRWPYTHAALLYVLFIVCTADTVGCAEIGVPPSDQASLPADIQPPHQQSNSEVIDLDLLIVLGDYFVFDCSRFQPWTGMSLLRREHSSILS